MNLSNYFVGEDKCSTREQRVIAPNELEKLPRKRKIDEVDQAAEEDLLCRVTREDSTAAQSGN